MLNWRDIYQVSYASVRGHFAFTCFDSGKVWLCTLERRGRRQWEEVRANLETGLFLWSYIVKSFIWVIAKGLHSVCASGDGVKELVHVCKKPQMGLKGRRNFYIALKSSVPVWRLSCSALILKSWGPTWLYNICPTADVQTAHISSGRAVSFQINATDRGSFRSLWSGSGPDGVTSSSVVLGRSSCDTSVELNPGCVSVFAFMITCRHGDTVLYM